MNSTMPPLRSLGSSALRVTPIGLGSAQFGKGVGIAGKYWETLDDGRIREIISVSLKGGINWIDTAEAYGGGESEGAIARSLKSLPYDRSDVILASKWFPLFRTAASIRDTIRTRLERLDTDYLDLFQIHYPWSFSSIKAQMEAMADLVHNGQIRHVGVSNFSAAQMRTAQKELARLGVPLVANQVLYNLLDRRIENNGLLETARELGITLLAYSPLAQGLLSGVHQANPGLIRSRAGFRRFLPAFRKKNIERSRRVVDTLETIAARHQATAAQVALSWTANIHGDAVVAIVGSTRVGQARENAEALSLTLTREEIAELDRVSKQFLR